MATLRELVEQFSSDDDPSNPFECAFLIAMVMRTAIQGEASTIEGECLSLIKAREHYDLESMDGIRQWLDDLGECADTEVPELVLSQIASAND